MKGERRRGMICKKGPQLESNGALCSYVCNTSAAIGIINNTFHVSACCFIKCICLNKMK